MVKIWELICRGKPGFFKWLPEKTLGNLLRILGYYAAVLYAVLLLCHAIFQGGFTARALAGLASIAAVAAMTAGMGFWMDKKLFFVSFSLGLASGALYMLVVAIFNTAPLWGDAASLFGFALIAFLGAIVGIGGEYARFLLKPRLKRSDDLE